MFDLSVVWFAIIVFSMLMYIVMDGFDLGIGILFIFNKDKDQRDIMVNTVAPVWDGNETWLVLGGAALYGAFPLAYSVIADALSIPIIVMLLGLIFRGVAFEFRFKATESHRPFWDKAFILGSVVATFSQGVITGAMMKGFDVAHRTFVGSDISWLSPFTLFCGFGLVIAYALLGCTWLIMKGSDGLHAKMSHLALPLLGVLLGVFAIISLWTPLTNAAIAQRWFSFPDILWFLPVPVLVIISSYRIYRAVQHGAHYSPFIMTLLLVFLGFSGLGISIWPNIIPPSISIQQAVAPQTTLHFMLFGAVFIIPVILAYTFWSYYVFRGKVTSNEGYH